MRPLPCCVLALSFLASGRALAQSLFDGAWKIDLNESQSSPTQYTYSLQNGIYRCTTCDPSLEIKADGKDHKIGGEPCYNTASLKVVDARTTEETNKKNGKAVGTTKITVSTDGTTATVAWTESCNARGDVVTGKDLIARIAQGPRGSHAISGSWRITKRLSRSDNALLVTLKLEGDTFTFADPTGQSYAARLDGTETQVQGDLSNTTVSVKRIDERTIEETNKRNGKLVEVNRFAASADGVTMTVTMENKSSGTTRQFVLRKQ